VRRAGLARPQGGARRSRPVRLLPGAGDHAAHRARGPGQRGYGAFALAHQGDGPAVPLLRDGQRGGLAPRRGHPSFGERRCGRLARLRGSAMRMLIAGGGTGGHLFPGLALAEEVKTRHPRNEVLFVGTPRGLETRIVPRNGFPLELVDVGPLKRQGTFGTLRGLGRLPRALWQSRRILRRFDPDVVVGVGGYASGPVVMAAWMMRIPTAVQEQNALPGFTNRTLGHFARACFIAFDEARAGFPAGRTHLLGNPIRRAFLDNYLHSKEPSGERLSILVTGGSQGAHVLNLRVAEALELLAPALGPRLSVMHQTGEKLAAELRGLEQDRERLRRMARQSGLLGRPQAAREIAEVCVSLCGRRLVREGRHLPEQASPETLPPRGGDHT